MAWEVEFTDEFAAWWETLNPEEQDSVTFGVRLLRQQGPNLKRPYADTLGSSNYPNMRELRCQHEGRPYVCCMRLILAELACCSSGAIRRGMHAGMQNSFQRRMLSIDNISKRYSKGDQ